MGLAGPVVRVSEVHSSARAVLRDGDNAPHRVACAGLTASLGSACPDIQSLCRFVQTINHQRSHRKPMPKRRSLEPWMLHAALAGLEDRKQRAARAKQKGEK